MKINLDKYYTPDETAKHCVSVAKKIIGIGNITEYIEPSAGGGVFLRYLDCVHTAYDIEPECTGVIEQDYLRLDIPYKKGRCVIGNPPFGTGNTLSVKFYKHSLKMCDYIAFILPASQYNNNQQMYEFDLIHSEMLPVVEFSGRSLLCCFNVYSRPGCGLNKTPIDYTLSDATVLEWRRGGSYPVPANYDIGICAWGSVGKEIEFQGQYALENYIVVNNPKYKAKIIDAIRDANWGKLYPCIATPRLGQWKIYKYLRECIPGIS